MTTSVMSPKMKTVAVVAMAIVSLVLLKSRMHTLVLHQAGPTSNHQHHQQPLWSLKPRSFTPLSVLRRPPATHVDGCGTNVNELLVPTQPRPTFSPYWARILHFVPAGSSRNCLHLFTTESSRGLAVTAEWRNPAAVLQQVLARGGWLGGMAPQHPKLTLTYQELARRGFVETVCEVGFNAGQSAITWLSAKPHLVLHSFDIAENPWVVPVARNVSRLFPGRFNLTVGDSRRTVPRWAPPDRACDIVSVDGGHEYDVVRQDLMNMRQVAAKEHILIVDDIYYPDVNRAWQEMVQQRLIQPLFDCRVPNIDIDFAIGYYRDV